MNAFRQLARWIVMLVTLVGSLALVGLMLVVGGTVIYRWFGGTFQGSYEVAETFTIVTITMAIFLTTAGRSHVDVRLVTDRFPPPLQRLLQIVLGLLAAAFWCVVFWSTMKDTVAMMAEGEITPVLGINIVPFRWIIVGGAAGVALVLFINVVRTVTGDMPQDVSTHEFGEGEHHEP